MAWVVVVAEDARGTNHGTTVGPSDLLSLSFRLPERSRVRLEIFNVLRERVALVLNAERPAARTWSGSIW